MNNGRVIIAGAGPGDAGLVTLKTFEYIKKAEVIVYDRLIGDEILKNASSSAELIYMGKESDGGGTLQERINETIYIKAMEGKLVLRLKGGDPFLFGRGGEEAEYLLDRGIEYEIVPGVTSAISVPAYGGIPVTHRDMASELHIITAHKKGDIEPDYKYIASLQGTLIVMMGAGSIGNISEKLMSYGRPAYTPCAMIENGTTGKQRTIISTLEKISADALRESIKPPSVIVIGDVAALGEKLAWFKSKPGIVITSDETNIDNISAVFGGSTIKLPMIRTSPKKFDMPHFRDGDTLFFTGIKGIRYFMESVEDIRIFAGIKIGAVGAKTEAELRKYRLIADIVPESYTVENGIRECMAQMNKGERLIIVTTDTSPIDVDKIKNESNNAEVIKLEIYTTEKVNYTENEIKNILDLGAKIVVLMSGSAVESFHKNKGFDILRDSGIEYASIGPVTTSVMKNYGIFPKCEAEEYTAEGIARAIEKTK